MPIHRTYGEFRCVCGKPYTTKQALGNHARFCSQAQLGPTLQPQPVSKPQPTPPSPLPTSTPVPVRCATCIALLPDVEKALCVVLIRAGMSLEGAQRTLAQMRPILRQTPELHPTHRTPA